MRRIHGFVLSLAGAAAIGFATPAARTDGYSPFLDDLQDRVEAMKGFNPEPDSARERRQAVALDRASAALALPSGALQEDLTHLLRAVTALEPAFPGDPDLRAEVHRAIYLYYYRLRTRTDVLRRERFVRAGDPEVGAAAGRGYVAARRTLDEYRFRRASWKGAVRLLQRAAGQLDRVSVALGSSRTYEFVGGGVTADVGGNARTWTIAGATWNEGLQGGPSFDIPPRLRVYAVSANPLSHFIIDFVEPAVAGADLTGGPDIVDYPAEGGFFPTEVARLQGDPDAPASSATLDALDVDAGTAFASFTLYRITPHFLTPITVTAEVNIDGGLERQ